jgi:hypothetical protein
VEFDQLADADLVLDRIYRGGTIGGTGMTRFRSCFALVTRAGSDLRAARRGTR